MLFFSAMNPNRKRGILLLCISFVFLISGCGGTMINGRWKDRDILIDGVDNEWRGAKFLLDRQYMTVGAINDNDSLYIRISTADAIHLYRAIAFGMIIRLTPRGRDRSSLEIKFPLGNPALFMSRNDKAFDANIQVREERIRTLSSSLTDSIGIVQNDSLVIYSSETVRRKGVFAVSGVDTRSLVCEFSIPLKKNRGNEISLEASPGDEVDLDIILPAPDDKTVRKLLQERYGKVPNVYNTGIRRRSDRMIDEQHIPIRLHLADK